MSASALRSSFEGGAVDLVGEELTDLLGEELTDLLGEELRGLLSITAMSSNSEASSALLLRATSIAGCKNNSESCCTDQHEVLPALAWKS